MPTWCQLPCLTTSKHYSGRARRFFVAANAVACTYLVLSIPLSIVHVVRPSARYSRLVLVFFVAVIT